MIKKVIQVILAIAIIGLVYLLYDQLMSPIRFNKEVSQREAVVISRIKDIRTAQQAYKQKYQKYTNSFDTLINFVLNDSLVFERSTGSADDSVAVAKGLVKTEKFSVRALDTIFRRTVTVDEVRQLPVIPFSDNKQFLLDAGQLTTESKVVVPVFECKAPYKLFLADLDNQELINLIDDCKVIDKYPGIKVGDMTQATNDAGNWE